ncbi:hypothetical protein LTR56_015168 [Elasticomyces elasticus]|nr:hypothetical protein LTR56_015168 [Elasticomyces elasticus]KAK3644462.1 hypothetical protein LTR22_015182 [Elasticomyces elasticus]KAK4915499.1 hypothetical protein LTR49_016346 [Elasticomyces elasticus]KAK5756216.1 hypothetical protein LTS12_013640 [Elasticomyces elasticus]
MAEYLQQFFGAAKSSLSSVSTDIDADFADFATAASPVAPSHAASAAAAATAATGFDTAHLSSADRPYTKWYRIWERASLQDFYQELFILPVIVLIVLVNLWGSRANRQRAKQWAATHLPLLEGEFSSIGFSGRTNTRQGLKDGDTDSSDLAKTLVGTTDVPDDMMREKSKDTYITYCTGRQNVAWVDIKLTLFPRYNPFKWFGEAIGSFFFDSIAMPVERMEATAYCFDGKEKAMVSQTPGGGSKDSTYDGFVWAVVHKDKMRQLRDDRYDLSLTTTKDHPKLPAWATVMSESAEVTEALLTADMVKAITDAGEDLEALIVSDQPIDAPKKLNDTVPKKRVSLSMRLNHSNPSSSLFATFIRLPDHLVSTAHFRPEAMRKIKATREEQMRKIRKVDEDEKSEERRLQSDKLKKEERDRKLGKLSDTEQKKFLEKEREKETRKSQKKQSVKG